MDCCIGLVACGPALLRMALRILCLAFMSLPRVSGTGGDAGCSKNPPALFSLRLETQRTRVRLVSSLAAAALDDLFEHPAFLELIIPPHHIRKPFLPWKEGQRAFRVSANMWLDHPRNGSWAQKSRVNYWCAW